MNVPFSELPGMTRRVPGPADSIKPANNLLTVSPSFQRRGILITTAAITDS